MKYNRDHDPPPPPSNIDTMTRDLTTDSNRLIREEEEEGREDREINTNLAREPIFYAKFSTRRFHRSPADNRLKYSERARGEGWRKCAAPAIYDKRGKGRGALKSEVVCACSASGNVDRVLIWREGGKYSYWWWCNQFAVRILLNPISRSRCQVNRDSFHWRGERVERTLLPSSSSLYLDPIHQGVLPSRRTCKKTRGRGSKRRQTDPSSPWNLVHSLPSSRVPRKIRTRGVDRWTGRKYWIKQIKVARAAISRSESRVQGDGGGGTMKRDTGDEIRMKLRYGRSNPWFSIRRVLSLPSLSLSLPPLLSSSCWTSAGQFVRVSLRTNVCNLHAEEGISFFCLSSFPFSSFPLLFLLFSRGNSRSVFNIFQNSKWNKKQWKFEFTRGEG